MFLDLGEDVQPRVAGNMSNLKIKFSPAELFPNRISSKTLWVLECVEDTFGREANLESWYSRSIELIRRAHFIGNIHCEIKTRGVSMIVTLRNTYTEWAFKFQLLLNKVSNTTENETKAVIQMSTISCPGSIFLFLSSHLTQPVLLLCGCLYRAIMTLLIET